MFEGKASENIASTANTTASTAGTSASTTCTSTNGMEMKTTNETQKKVEEGQSNCNSQNKLEKSPETLVNVDINDENIEEELRRIQILKHFKRLSKKDLQYDDSSVFGSFFLNDKFSLLTFSLNTFLTLKPV